MKKIILGLGLVIAISFGCDSPENQERTEVGRITSHKPVVVKETKTEYKLPSVTKIRNMAFGQDITFDLSECEEGEGNLLLLTKTSTSAVISCGTVRGANK